MTVDKTIKNLILCLNLLLTVLVYGQDEFAINYKGLTPKLSISKIDSLSKSALYLKTLEWIEENETKYRLLVDSKIENEAILVILIKENAVNLNKQYYNVKYKINISFEKEQYKFEPTRIQLKLNSKYDMGWKDFDLTNGAIFFDKEKVIKKYKYYLKDITRSLNELSMQLNAGLKN
ncbi:DUF4468 domain-containing protein [Seonamhaeicola sp.]|uniref:DUF4468 domain-containing protein n=1 Tax=Seonamhaeicola sp. TaxID=1912245 RepID=UPI00261100BE|nr:DUF4468 domain-containing protein [Seonamhaeicola sp.]